MAGTVTPVTDRPNATPRRGSFSKMERAKREELRRRYRDTTPGERVEEALRLSALASELRSGLRKRGG